jgi:probable F420-dependent oxidoreductase
MKLGFFGINVGPCATPAVLARVAKAAEQAGFESLWTGEHIVLPDPHAAPSPAPPETPFLDSAVALTYAAAVTTQIKLGTGIVILPQRNPLVLAKEMASLDVLSGGRLILGVASGYLHQEFAALGIPFAGRGPRSDEYIDAMREIWTAKKPCFDGRYAKFSGVDAQPRPVQQPTPPFVIGGQSPPAYRRALVRGNGWYGFSLDLAATRICLADIEKERGNVERPEMLGKLEISVTPPAGTSPDDMRRYRDLGVDRVIPIGFLGAPDDIVRSIETTASALVGPS